MPEKYKKLCISCSMEFESAGNRRCPHCGSDDWRFIDSSGRQRNFYAEALAQRKRVEMIRSWRVIHATNYEK